MPPPKPPGKSRNKSVFNVSHVNRQIPPQAHTPMYLWHKYWARKTWNVVGEFINSYCPSGGVVFDPFCGSGISAMEALKLKRRVIVCDLNPIATEITRLTIKPVDNVSLYEAFRRIEHKVRKRIESLYTTTCRNCGDDVVFDCAIWINGVCKEIRYQACPKCKDRKADNCSLNAKDAALLQELEHKTISEWYPKDNLSYPDGRPFKEKQKYETVDQLFTKRNLQALAWLMEAIKEEKNNGLREFLQIAFSSMVHLCSRMIAISNPSQTSHHTPFSSTGWTQHSYWYATNFMEQNVWCKFESAINGHQGLLKAKAESNKYFSSVKIASSYKDVLAGKADVYIHTGDCLSLMKKLPPGCIDYIFTDPPYDSSIQYGELSFIWVSWLGKDRNYIKSIVASEIVRNEQQLKDFGVYYSLLSSSFDGMYHVLKPSRFLTLTFHNPTFMVRNATIRAGVFAGFEFEKIHHQPLGQSSAKALLQPFGSAQGDFYLRFRKPALDKAAVRPEEIDEIRFETIVVETTIALLAERAEPTPYTIIINYIDPVLAKNGFFGSLKSGLDIQKVLKKHLGQEFVLLPTKVGDVEGKLWWFRDASMIARLDEVPLTERVEQTVYRKLRQKGKVTFTEVWDAVSTEFPNSLTSDTTSILDALKIYARQVTGGFWLLKPDIQQRDNEHSEILGILAVLGKQNGFDIWIGRREQHEKDCGLVASGKQLKEYMTISRLTVGNAQNRKVLENIDMLWIKNGQIRAVFEVESTTSMTSALMRGSNVEKSVEKFMVIPEERYAQFESKMTSPLFQEHFVNENWRLLYFDTLRISYGEEKGKLNIHSLIDKKTFVGKTSAPEPVQESLF